MDVNSMQVSIGRDQGRVPLSQNVLTCTDRRGLRAFPAEGKEKEGHSFPSGVIFRAFSVIYNGPPQEIMDGQHEYIET